MLRKAIIGLGNPEERYQDTPHNTGYRIVEALASGLNGEFHLDEDLSAEITVVQAHGCQWLLVKPVTGMNDSGVAVKAVVDRYQLALEDVLVVYDDVTIPMGKMRFQQSGSAGGHNGVKSIIEHLATKEFTRLKVAVGPAPTTGTLLDYVLSPVAEQLLPLINEVLSAAANAVAVWSENGLQSAMNAFNGIDLRQT